VVESSINPQARHVEQGHFPMEVHRGVVGQGKYHTGLHYRWCSPDVTITMLVKLDTFLFAMQIFFIMANIFIFASLKSGPMMLQSWQNVHGN
jgi:hypothetical protein